MENGQTLVAPAPRGILDPATGKHILVKDGRFGMYVTDGETNATLRRGDTLEALDLIRAQELKSIESSQSCQKIKNQ